MYENHILNWWERRKNKKDNNKVYSYFHIDTSAQSRSSTNQPEKDFISHTWKWFFLIHFGPFKLLNPHTAECFVVFAFLFLSIPFLFLFSNQSI